MLPAPSAVPPATPSPEAIEERLATVIDPEVGIGIVDLGLVYETTIDDAAITVTMTVTTPACPLGPYLEDAVEQVLADLAGPRLVLVDLVFDPPWDPSMISPAGREQLGWGGS